MAQRPFFRQPRVWMVLGFAALVALVAVRYWPQYATSQQHEQPVTKNEHTFRDIAAEAGLNFRMAFLPQEQGEVFKINLYDHGCGVAVGDFDNDGNDDIWLRGTQSCRDAIGAVVHLFTKNEILTRQVPAAGGYLANSSNVLHFGLGTRHVLRAEIIWPSGVRQIIFDPEINRTIEVIEPPESSVSVARTFPSGQ